MIFKAAFQSMWHKRHHELVIADGVEMKLRWNPDTTIEDLKILT